MEGWVKLHRKLLEKPIWIKSTPEQKTILITLLLMANHKESEWEWKGKKFKVSPGQFVTSLDSILKQCGKGITIQNVRSALKKFEKYEFLTNKSTKCGRLITIENWAFYQCDDEETNKVDNKELTKKSQRTNKEVTPNKNVIKKECKNERNKSNKSLSQQSSDESPKIKFDKNSFEILTVNYLAAKILELNPKAKVPMTLIEKQKWAVHVDRMKRLDKRNELDIKRVLKFATEDQFWKSNILSTKKMRDKFDTLYMQMQSDRQPHKRKTKSEQFIENYNSPGVQAWLNEED